MALTAEKKAQRRKHYEENREAILVDMRERGHRIRAQLRAYKRLHGCSVCGENHPAALEFHHRDPATKTFELGQPGSRSWPRLESEIEKCDLLCCNCHRKLHAEGGEL